LSATVKEDDLTWVNSNLSSGGGGGIQVILSNISIYFKKAPPGAFFLYHLPLWNPLELRGGHFVAFHRARVKTLADFAWLRRPRLRMAGPFFSYQKIFPKGCLGQGRGTQGLKLYYFLFFYFAQTGCRDVPGDVRTAALTRFCRDTACCIRAV